MNPHNHSVIGKEHPYSHQIQIGSVIGFFLILILDFFFIRFLTQEVEDIIPLYFRVPLFLFLVIYAFILVNYSHNKIFSKSNESPHLVSSGVYSYTRHPMYLSILVLLLSFLVLSLSFLSFIPWIIAVFLFNRMVIFEENELINILGDEYRNYMKRVPRWIPRPSFRRT